MTRPWAGASQIVVRVTVSAAATRAMILRHSGCRPRMRSMSADGNNHPTPPSIGSSATNHAAHERNGDNYETKQMHILQHDRVEAWSRVAVGLMQVVHAGTAIASSHGNLHAMRTTQHGLEVFQGIATWLQQQQHHQHQQHHPDPHIDEPLQPQQQQQQQQQQQPSEDAKAFPTTTAPPASTRGSASALPTVTELPSDESTKQQQQQQQQQQQPRHRSSNDSIRAVSGLALENRIHSTKTAMLQPSEQLIFRQLVVDRESNDQNNEMATTFNENTNNNSIDKTPVMSSNDDLTSIQGNHPASTLRLQQGQPVPATRFHRAMGFASLGVGLALGTAVEGLQRILSSSTGSSSSSSSNNASSWIMNDANADRLAATLCRMRGAALKMGQMLSIQDASLLPTPLSRALQQVRHGATAMPEYQFLTQMSKQLGSHWQEKFVSFEHIPFAAASIGQVHRGKIDDPTNGNVVDVVIKVQYPGVAMSIESDLRNLGMLVSMTGLAPKGLFLENVIRVGEQELKVECDYIAEMNHQHAIRQLVLSDPILQRERFVVPRVFPHLCTSQVLVSEYCPGGTIDQVSYLSQEERNRIARTILYLTMQELFVWRYMQTDPNWGNFLYDVDTGTVSLIDFGAARKYSKSFVDGYLRIVWASANRDEPTLMEQSRRMHFLTGEENDMMLHAHKMSGYTVGEPFACVSNKHDPINNNSSNNVHPFDFRGSNISTRMGSHTAVFLQHRLTPPPEEVYTLHRKLAGAYMLCIQLGAVIPCRDLLQNIIQQHVFEDGLDPPPQIN